MSPVSSSQTRTQGAPIATSDPALPTLALTALAVSGVPFALLHDEERVLAQGVESDVDIAVGVSPRTVLARSLDQLHASNLHPIVVNEYDAGGSASAYIGTADGKDGLQLDMYFDPSGVGRFGLRTGPLLEHSVEGTRWRIVAPEHHNLYLLRKRHWKGDLHRIDHVVNELASHDSDQLRRAIQSLAVPEIGVSIRRVLNGDQIPFRAPRRNLPYDLGRRLKRLRRPVGFWVEIIGSGSESIAKDLAQRFDRFLTTAVGKRPGNWVSLARWLLRDVAPIRLRPGLFISWTPEESGTPHANLEIPHIQKPVPVLAHQIVTAMESRLELTTPQSQA